MRHHFSSDEPTKCVIQWILEDFMVKGSNFSVMQRVLVCIEFSADHLFPFGYAYLAASDILLKCRSSARPSLI